MLHLTTSQQLSLRREQCSVLLLERLPLIGLLIRLALIRLAWLLSNSKKGSLLWHLHIATLVEVPGNPCSQPH